MKNKISAEEKYYIKLNTKLKQDYNKVYERYIQVLKDSIMLQEIIDDLEKQINQLKNENKILIEHKGLSLDELKKLVKGNEAINGLLNMSKLIGNGW